MYLNLGIGDLHGDRRRTRSETLQVQPVSSAAELRFVPFNRSMHPLKPRAPRITRGRQPDSCGAKFTQPVRQVVPSTPTCQLSRRADEGTPGKLSVFRFADRSSEKPGRLPSMCTQRFFDIEVEDRSTLEKGCSLFPKQVAEMRIQACKNPLLRTGQATDGVTRVSVQQPLQVEHRP